MGKEKATKTGIRSFATGGWKYDPEKARHYLKKAGLENHVFKIHPSDAAFEGAVDTAILFKEHAAKAGIKIDVVREPADGYWTNVWMKKDWSFSFWNGRPTEDWTFSLAYAGDAAWNECFWKNEKFDYAKIADRYLKIYEEVAK